jgi:hypothetical protein
MKNRIILWIQALLSALTVPLSFLPVFHGVGHLPSRENPSVIVQVDFYHSAHENLSAIDCAPFLYAYFALVAGAVVCSVCSLLLPDKGRLKVASHILFVVTAVCFAILFVLSSTVARGY